MPNCSNCGTDLEDWEQFCSDCGSPVKKAVKMGDYKPRRNKKTPRKNTAMPFMLVLLVLFAAGGILVFTLLQGSENDSDGSHSISGPDEESPAEVNESSVEENPGGNSVGNIINDGTADQQGDQWSVSFTSAENIFFGAAWNGDLYVVVGFGDNEGDEVARIYTSSDGTDWTRRYEKADIRLGNVIWSNNQFVSVGGDPFNEGNSIILTSHDGINWVERYTGSAYLWDVVWNDNHYMAVGFDRELSTNIILTSPDGVIWTKKIEELLYYSTSITWDGSNYFATTLAGDDSVILSSPDGINWVERYTGSGHLYDIAWNGKQYVAVGGNMEDHAGVILTSPDGASWTKQDTSSIPMLLGINWNGNQFTAAGAGNSIITSLDGFSWEKHYTGVEVLLYDITWNGSQFIAVGYDPFVGTGYIMLSK